MEEGQGTHKSLSLVLGILAKEIFLPSKSHKPPPMHRRPSFYLLLLCNLIEQTGSVCCLPDIDLNAGITM